MDLYAGLQEYEGCLTAEETQQITFTAGKFTKAKSVGHLLSKAYTDAPENSRQDLSILITVLMLAMVKKWRTW